MKVVKRNGTLEDFDRLKIEKAILGAMKDLGQTDEGMERLAKRIAHDLEKEFMMGDNENLNSKSVHEISIQEIEDRVEEKLMASHQKNIARQYIRYRYRKEMAREVNKQMFQRNKNVLELLNNENEYLKTENSNKNPTILSVQRDYMAGEVSKEISKNFLLPKDILDAHEKGIIHFHDMDYFAQSSYNCSLINLEDMLRNGTVISETMIERPKSFSTACNIATQIIAQVASSQYGGQSISLSHLAPFVDVSRQKFRKEVREEFTKNHLKLSTERIDAIAEERLLSEVKKGIQTIQYQILTLMTTNGQAPFLSIFMYLNEVEDGQIRKDLALIIEETLKQRIQGVKNEKGIYITPAFPKLLYVLDKNNIYEDSEYWYLTKLAAKCTAKRMVPDYISEKIMKQLKVDKAGNGQCYPCMGCRSFLTPYIDPESNKPKYYGRFNQGVVTINLVDVACSSYKDMKKFWEIFDERLELCHKALRCRHEHLKGTLSDVAPILWQYGALARLRKGEKIDKLLYGGYSTISLGYAGLYECVKYMTGKSHTDTDVKPFALAIMQKMNDKCNQWKAEENIDYSLYGTPIESTTYKFSKCLQKRFGKIPGVTDKNYITNSYHIHVTESIDAFQKLSFESEFQKLSPGGAISYVEVPNMQDNIDAVLTVMKHIYENIIYAELNTKSDYCMECGYDGEIQIKEDEDGKLIWVCPSCGNRDQDKMSVARRSCGYIGTQFWNQGRTQEIKERVLHL